MAGNFNLVAPIYDRLAHLVFGSKLDLAQCTYLDQIPENSHVLILGGGSGSILEALGGLNKKMTVTYLDTSSEMIRLAKARKIFDQLSISFQVAGIEAIPHNSEYDVILTNFYLDLFDERTLKEVVQKLYHHLEAKGFWIVTDFYKTDRLSHKLLILTMIWFFRITSGIGSKELLPFEQYLNQCGLSKMKEKMFKNGMLKSQLFTKVL